MATAEIRKAAPADAATLQSAIDRVAREERWLGSDRAHPVDAVAAFLRARLDAGEPHYVAVDDGTVVGWCDIERYPAESRRHCGRLGMGLLPDWRGRGLGGRLLDAALDHADRIGLARVELDVVADNHAGIALYQRAGFEHEGLRTGGWSLGGQTRDLVLMARVRAGSEE